MVLSQGLKLCYSSLLKNITAQVRLILIKSLRLADLEPQIRLSCLFHPVIVRYVMPLLYMVLEVKLRAPHMLGNN